MQLHRLAELRRHIVVAASIDTLESQILVGDMLKSISVFEYEEKASPIVPETLVP